MEKNHDWIKEVKVIKIKEYTHVMKLEFQTVEEAERALERGLLLFNMHVSSEQISRDEFVNVLTCFRCCWYDDHPTKSCTETKIICSECSEEGHKWSECKSQTKRCINCRGTHRTLAMSCPIKRDVINRIKENKQKEEREKKLNNIVTSLKKQ